jgi:hypothetical protein
LGDAISPVRRSLLGTSGRYVPLQVVISTPGCVRRRGALLS